MSTNLAVDRMHRNTRPAVAIVGPGRSGTSVVSHLLNRCGLYLGEGEDIMAAGPGNPDGYWEHLGIVRLNDALLDHFGGGWDVRPVNPDWTSPDIDHLRTEAQRLISALSSGHLIWGWRDPRTSFTLPFWQSLISDLKVIMCVRHPLEVAASLTRQHYTSTAFGVRWWHDCITATLETADPYLVLFDALLENPREQVARLCDFWGLVPSDDALTCIRPDRRSKYPRGKSMPSVEALYDVLKCRALGQIQATRS